jgi:hypothetical protein
MMDQIGSPRPALGIAWQAADPVVVAARIGTTFQVGMPVERAVIIGGLAIVVHPSGRQEFDRLVVVNRADLAITSELPGDVALAWATVDLGRAAGELGEEGIGTPPYVPQPDVPGLGARAARGAAGRFGVPVLLLEPMREGRLAATLGRHGEGPCGLVAWAIEGRPLELAQGQPTAGPHVLVGGREYHRAR